MLHRDEDILMLSCDSCGTETLTHTDLPEMVAEAKADGWKIRNPNGVWTHHCASCDNEESRLDQARRKFGLK